MYNALVEMHEIKETEYNPESDTIKCANHEQVLDIVLKHFYKKPSGIEKYGWSKSSDLSNFL